MRRSTRPRPPDEGPQQPPGGEQEDNGRRPRRRRTASGVVPQDLLKLDRPFDSPNSFRCLPCAHLRIKCSRKPWPCDRCWKRSLRCAPPSEEFLISAQAAAAATGIASPLLEMVFRTFDPAKMAQCLVGVFLDWHKRGRIHRGAAHRMLRTYRARSRKLGVDYSYGATDAMARALGLTSVDLEDPGEVAYGPPALPDGDGAAVGAATGSVGSANSTGGVSSACSVSSSTSALFAAEVAQLRTALEGSGAWRFLSGPGLANSSTVYLTYLVGEHTVLLSASSQPEVTAGGCLGAAEVLSSQQMRRTLVPLLFAGAVAPDDLEAWFQIEVAGTFSECVQPCSRFVKMMDKAGDINLYLITTKRVFVEEVGASCRVTIVELAPQSRHLCPVPSHPHHVVNTYRKGRAPSPASLSPTPSTAPNSPGLPSGPSPGTSAVASSGEKGEQEAEAEAGEGGDPLAAAIARVEASTGVAASGTGGATRPSFPLGDRPLPRLPGMAALPVGMQPAFNEAGSVTAPTLALAPLVVAGPSSAPLAPPTRHPAEGACAGFHSLNLLSHQSGWALGAAAPAPPPPPTTTAAVSVSAGMMGPWHGEPEEGMEEARELLQAAMGAFEDEGPDAPLFAGEERELIGTMLNGAFEAGPAEGERHEE